MKYYLLFLFTENKTDIKSVVQTLKCKTSFTFLWFIQDLLAEAEVADL